MKKLLVIAMTAACVLATTAIAGIPQLINYQGRLTDAGGAPANGLRYMQFKIYDASTAGNVLWSNLDGLEEVQVTDGLFSYLLGVTRPLPDTLKKYDSLWLGIRVSPDPEMTPRTRLTSVNFAYRTVLAENALNAIRADSASYANRALKSDTATFAKQAGIADSARVTGRSWYADTAGYVNIPTYYHRIAFDTIGGSTMSSSYVQVGQTLIIPPAHVSKFVQVHVWYACASAGNANDFIDIRIGQAGAETSKLAHSVLASVDFIRSEASIIYYYEPTADEKTNGFNVKFYLKCEVNGVVGISRTEVFGL
jgi:hypothetical protein